MLTNLRDGEKQSYDDYPIIVIFNDSSPIAPLPYG